MDEQNSKSLLPVILAVIITAFLVGGGVYRWQNLPTADEVLEESGELITGNLAVTYDPDWTRAGGYVEFLEVQEFDTLKLLVFTNVQKDKSGWESFNEFKNSFQGATSRVEENINPLFAFEIMEYEKAVDNEIYNLYSEGPGTVALWQNKFNYALIDAGSLHQEDGNFLEFLKNIQEVVPN